MSHTPPHLWPTHIKERFWAKAAPPNENGCRMWTGCVTSGYGRFQFEKRLWGAHRVAVELAGVRIPGGMVVCRRCDVPACVNPDHLYVGTYADNSRDAMDRDRTARGQRSGVARLTDHAVIDARRRHANGETSVALAAEYGVTQAAMWYALIGRTWSHLPGAVASGGHRGERCSGSKLTDSTVSEARARRDAGATVEALAQEFGMSAMAMWNALTGGTWGHVPGACARGPRRPRSRKVAA
jgi:hypothetical protein